MANMSSKVNIPLPADRIYRKSYTQPHITTTSFMSPHVGYCREFVMDGHRIIKPFSKLIALPQVLPTFGKATHHERFFFVPFRVLMRSWNEFIAGTSYTSPTGETMITNVPLIKNSDIIDWFLNHSTGSGTFITPSGTAVSDIRISGHSTASYNQYYTLTKNGIRALSLLVQCGIKVNWNYRDIFEHPATKLLCLAKVMIDWYYPSAYVGSSEYSYLNMILQNNYGDTYMDNVFLEAWYNVCQYNCYDSDYLVNGFDNPDSPNLINFNPSISITDITNNSNPLIVTNDPSTVATPSSSSFMPSNGTPFIGGSSGNTSSNMSGVITQYVDKALRSLTDYTKRHQLSGYRAIDRLLSEYGVQLDSEIMKRSIYLGEQAMDIDFYEINSTADTADQGGQVLGALGGKGIGYSPEFKLDFENDEAGFIISVCTIDPVVYTFQGQHRENMHKTLMDFYHGDFDHMDVQAISKREVYVPVDGQSNIAGAGLNNEVFAFAPRYIEYNTPEACVSGMFLSETQRGLLPALHLFRDLSYYEQSTLSQMVHDIDFVQGRDRDQYLRLFYSVKEDPFMVFHNYDVENIDKTLPAYDTYEFDHDSNEKVSLAINGSKLN